ncbi:MAG: FIST N-terminal domain-containing protein, partial [Pontibacterium sp.]
MPLQQAVSHSQDVSEATAELHQSLYREDLNCLLFFCSAKYDLLSLAEQMREAFGCSRVVGCTTAGEITPDGYGQGCISAIGFYGDEFAVAIKGVEDLANFSLFEAQSLVDGLIGEIRQDSPIPVMGN